MGHVEVQVAAKKNKIYFSLFPCPEIVPQTLRCHPDVTQAASSVRTLDRPVCSQPWFRGRNKNQKALGQKSILVMPRQRAIVSIVEGAGISPSMSSLVLGSSPDLWAT